jgi:uncharacterized membrane-anchored protein YhcB (DUF1043 family)
MFGIPGEIFWPTAAFGSMIVLVFGGVLVLRLLPAKARALEQRDREAMEDLQVRAGQVDQLQKRVGELEERVDFTERLLAKQRDDRRLAPPKD